MGCNPNILDSHNYAALHYASEEGDVLAVKKLLSQTELKVNVRDGLDRTALHLAVLNGHPDVVHQLLNHPVCSADEQVKAKTYP